MSIKFVSNDELTQHYRQLSEAVQQGQWVNSGMRAQGKWGALRRFLCCLANKLMPWRDNFASIRIDTVAQQVLSNYHLNTDIIEDEGIDAICDLMEQLNIRSHDKHSRILNLYIATLKAYKDKDTPLSPATGTVAGDDPKDDPSAVTPPPAPPSQGNGKPLPPPPNGKAPPPPPPPPKLPSSNSWANIKNSIQQSKVKAAQQNAVASTKGGADSYKQPEPPVASGVAPHEFAKNMNSHFRIAKAYLFEKKDDKGSYGTDVKNKGDLDKCLPAICSQYGVSREKVLMSALLYLDYQSWSDSNKQALAQRKTWLQQNPDADVNACPYPLIDKKACFASCDDYIARLDGVDAEKCKAIYYFFMGYKQSQIGQLLALQMGKDDLKDYLVELLS